MHSEDLWWFLAWFSSILWSKIPTWGMLRGRFQDPMKWNNLINYKGLWQRLVRCSQTILLLFLDKKLYSISHISLFRCDHLCEFQHMNYEEKWWMTPLKWAHKNSWLGAPLSSSPHLLPRSQEHGKALVES